MALIRPCADLRNNYNEISKICHNTNEPVYITKNGSNDLVVLSNETYESLLETGKKEKEKEEEERIEKLVDEHFQKQYANFEEFQKDVWNHIEKALKEVGEGKYLPMEEAIEELEKEYGVPKVL